MNEIETLKKLYPNLSPENLVIAKEMLDRYLSLVWQIMEDERMSQTAFPESNLRGTIQGKVDSQIN